MGNVKNPQAGGYEPAFPFKRDYAVGECPRGHRTFISNSTDIEFNLVLENGVGARAV